MRSVWKTLSKSKTEFLAAVKRSRKLHRPCSRTGHLPSFFKLAHPAQITRTGVLGSNRTGDLAGMICIAKSFEQFSIRYLGYYAFAPYNGRGFMTLD